MTRSPRNPHLQMTWHEFCSWVVAQGVPAQNECIDWPYGGDKRGYGQVSFSAAGGDRRRFHTHRIAYAAAYGLSINELSEVPIVMHSCDNPACINARHLSAATHTENMADCYRKGRMISGGTPVRTILSDDDIRAIRARRAAGEPLASIADAFDIDFRSVGNIAKRKRWAQVED